MYTFGSGAGRFGELLDKGRTSPVSQGNMHHNQFEINPTDGFELSTPSLASLLAFEN